MKHSITFLAAAALVGATVAAKADNDIKTNPYSPPPKPSTSGAGQETPSTSGSGQQTNEPGITDKGHDLDSDPKTGPEPAMMCFVTYLRIGTRNSGAAATQFIDGTF
jgi:hypothetical protein